MVADVLNDFDPLPTGRLKLPNLAAGVPVVAVVRLTVPPGAGEREVCHFRLAWDAPGVPGRQTLTVPLRLPSVDAATWEALAPVAEVRERADLLLIARHKKRATRQFEQGDRAGATGAILEAGQILLSAPATPETAREARALDEVRAHLEGGDGAKFLKGAKYQAHQRRRSEPYRDS